MNVTFWIKRLDLPDTWFGGGMTGRKNVGTPEFSGQTDKVAS